MKILMFFPGRVEHLPPLLTAAVCSRRLGARVKIVASSAIQETKTLLEAHGVELSIESATYPNTKWGRMELRARVGARLVRDRLALSPDCIWYHGEAAMEYAFVPGINRKAIIVAHAHEMYDRKLSSRLLARFGSRVSHIVICPEINRQWILKIRTGSTATFHCIPNRPLDLFVPEHTEDGCARTLFYQLGGSPKCRRFLVYQGVMMQGRGLPHLIAAFRETRYEDVGLIMMGGEEGEPFRNHLRQLASGDSRIVFFSRLPPPRHLQVTKGCIGGILLYEPNSLNNLYCAPNKIYEYSACGLPMLLPNFPGLTYLNDKYRFGQLCDPLSPISIRKGIERLLLMDPLVSKERAKTFLDTETEPLRLYSRVVADIGNRMNSRQSR